MRTGLYLFSEALCQTLALAYFAVKDGFPSDYDAMIL
jgi:hypothetical protein